MNKEKENRAKLWAEEILGSSLDAVAGENLVEAIGGGLAEKLGLTLPGLYVILFPISALLASEKILLGSSSVKVTDFFYV